MKKVLFVVDERKLGGVSILLENILNNLDLNNLDITILILHNNGNRFENIKNKNVKIIYATKAFSVIDMDLKGLLKQFKLVEVVKKLLMIYRLKTGRLAKFIQKQREKIQLHSYDIEIAFKAGFCSAFVAYGNSKCKINWIHEDYSTYNKTKRYENTFKKIFNMMDRHITVSEDAKRSFCSIYSNEEKTHVIENYIDIKDILDKANLELTQSEYVINKNKLNFVALGRFCYEKGFERIIEAVHSLKQEQDISNIHVYIIGYGEYGKKLKEQIIRLNIQEHIDIIDNKIFNYNPYAFMKQCDLYILSSTSESFGMVRVEALSLGLPVITTNVAYTNELIQDKYGIIVENSNYGIYKGLKEVITNSELVETLKQKVSNYSYESNNKDILKKIQKLLEE